LIPALANVILMEIFDGVFDYASKKLTDFENHKLFSEYEYNYIVKRFTFNFFSLCGPLIILAFLNDMINVHCD